MIGEPIIIGELLGLNREQPFHADQPVQQAAEHGTPTKSRCENARLLAHGSSALSIMACQRRSILSRVSQM